MTNRAEGGYQAGGGYQADVGNEAVGGYQGQSGQAPEMTICAECAALLAADRAQVHEQWHRALADKLAHTGR